MSNLSDETPVARLGRLMAKRKILPKYELIFSECNRGVPNFIWRVTCPIIPGGPPFIAEGCYGLTKKEAKHNAALTFMQAFLNYDENNTQLNTKPSSYSKSAAATVGTDICSEGLDMLKIICSKKNLGSPKVADVGIGGPPYAQIFTAECTVSDLCIKGRGKSVVEARLHATAKMIQILMETAPITKILKSLKLTFSDMLPLPLKRNINEITSASNDQKESQLPVENGVNGKRKMDARSPEKPRAMHRVRRRPDTAKNLLELIEARKKAVRIEESNDNSAPNVNLINLSENSEQNIFTNKSNDTLLNNNIPNCVNSEVINTISDDIHKFTRLQAVSEINRTLGGLEKQLYYKVLKALVYSQLANQQTVEILSHNYQVLINENSSPQIFEGNTECTDQSIRITCLTKLLMDLKEHITFNSSKIIKQKQ